RMKSLEHARSHNHDAEIVEPVREPTPSVRRRKILRKTSEIGGERAADVPGAWSFADAINAGIHSGHALPGDLRAKFESSLGTDLGAVRVHGDSAAAEASASLGARAFAVGQDVVMGAGQYAPDTNDGAWLLAHEVAHTVQQRGASSGPQTKLEVREDGDTCEREAGAAANAVMNGPQAQAAAADDNIVSVPPLSMWDAVVHQLDAADQAIAAYEQHPSPDGLRAVQRAVDAGQQAFRLASTRLQQYRDRTEQGGMDCV